MIVLDKIDIDFHHHYYKDNFFEDYFQLYVDLRKRDEYDVYRLKNFDITKVPLLNEPKSVHPNINTVVLRQTNKFLLD